jgi:ring-1,2-phenylacetyl-CoA epoxidase subunit PaaC
MVALPVGDWAFSMTRQYLFDAYEAVLLEMLSDSHYEPFQDAAAKLRKEEAYHLRHTSAWVTRLGLGTEESHRRMRAALNALWNYAQQLFVPTDGQEDLAQAGYFPLVGRFRSNWLSRVTLHLAEAGLTIPADSALPAASRSSQTNDLVELLDEMQKVARLDPEAEW